MSKKAIKAVTFAVGLLSATALIAEEVLPRSGWKAAPPVKPMLSHQPMRITVHHTAVRQNPSRSLEQKLRALQGFSQREELLADGRLKTAWADVPYHFYIDVSGRVGEGRDVGYVGDTNTNYDPTGHIAVVLEGNFEVEMPSDAQINTLVNLLEQLSDQFSISSEAIGVHKSFAATACPGRNLEAAMPAVLSQLDGR